MATDEPPVLLVDDVEDARDIYQTYFAHRGRRMVCAADGREAIARAQQERPCIILLDLRMPGMTGTETLQQLRSDPALAGVPIVAFTAHALAEERLAALGAGFDAVIAKPCLPDELYRAVDEILTRS
jgi:CheY-like chemotaxis protein